MTCTFYDGHIDAKGTRQAKITGETSSCSGRHYGRERSADPIPLLHGPWLKQARAAHRERSCRARRSCLLATFHLLGSL